MSALSGAELKAIYAASVSALAPVEYGGDKVITTEVLAKAYGTASLNIQVNHSRHSDRFEEGKHFHKVKGQALRDLRLTLGMVQIPAKARSLILWTERGAARHAKMLETNEAWDVFEALEDSYFKHRGAHIKEPADEVKLSTVQDREPLLLAAVRMVVKHKLKFNVVYQTMNHFAGSHRFAEMTKDQVAEAEQFVERFLLGNDTRQDWLRIGANQAERAGGNQPELLGFSVPGTLGNR